MAINVKRTAGRCKKHTVVVKRGNKVLARFKARHHCGGKTKQQRALAVAAKKCAGTGKIGGKARNTCLRKAL